MPLGTSFCKLLDNARFLRWKKATKLYHMSLQTLHFRIGDGAGKLLMSIAQEHLCYTLDPVKALKTMTDSLSGCSRELALQIILGKNKVLTVLVENDEDFFIVEDRTDEHEDYPYLDPIRFFKRTRKKLENDGKEIYEMLNTQYYRLANIEEISVNLQRESILKYSFHDDLSDVIYDLEHNKEIKEFKFAVQLARDFLNEIQKVTVVLHTLKLWYPEEFINVEDFDYHYTIVDLIKNKVNTLENDIFTEKDPVTATIEGMHEIQKAIELGIKPVNILDNYSAGWLSQEGEFFGLNGEIQNMLHAELADMIVKEGYVKLPPNFEYAENYDELLNELGWVKIHADWILYEGWMNEQKGGDTKNIPMSEKQINLLYKYGQTCHMGRLKIGLRMEMISAVRFQSTSIFQIRKLFEF